jgi:hypothetical protein
MTSSFRLSCHRQCGVRELLLLEGNVRFTCGLGICGGNRYRQFECRRFRAQGVGAQPLRAPGASISVCRRSCSDSTEARTGCAPTPAGRESREDRLGCRTVEANGRPATAPRAGVPGMTFRGPPQRQMPSGPEASKRHAGLPREASWGDGASGLGFVTHHRKQSTLGNAESPGPVNRGGYLGT